MYYIADESATRADRGIRYAVSLCERSEYRARASLLLVADSSASTINSFLNDPLSQIVRRARERLTSSNKQGDGRVVDFQHGN